MRPLLCRLVGRRVRHQSMCNGCIVREPFAPGGCRCCIAAAIAILPLPATGRNRRSEATALKSPSRSRLAVESSRACASIVCPTPAFVTQYHRLLFWII